MPECGCAERRLRRQGHYAACADHANCLCGQRRVKTLGHYANCTDAENKPVKLDPNGFRLYMVQRVKEAIDITDEPESGAFEKGWSLALQTVLQDLETGQYAEYLDKEVLTKFFAQAA